MSITQQILKNDPSLQIHIEGKWNEAFDGSTGYTSFNDAGVECEVGEFLYGMVRILQPERVLETGTHHGIGASYLASGLRDNGKGHLDTIEFNKENYDIAVKRFASLGIQNRISARLMKAEDFNPIQANGDCQYDLILLDTEPNLRFNELLKFYRNLSHGGYVFIHDLHRHLGQHDNAEHGFGFPFGRLPTRMQDFLQFGDLVPFYFPTPRGLTGFYKPHPNDYGRTKI
jgi:predicted O-methyltransferase YrrM